MLYRLYGKDKVAEFIRTPNCGETLVHRAARSGLYSLVIDEMIGELGFNLDFWESGSRLTVVNQIVHHRRFPWDDEEKTQIRKLLRMSKDLLLKNSFGSHTARVAFICQREYPENYKLVMEEFERHMRHRFYVNTVCLDRYRRDSFPKSITKLIFREI